MILFVFSDFFLLQRKWLFLKFTIISDSIVLSFIIKNLDSISLISGNVFFFIPGRQLQSFSVVTSESVYTLVIDQVAHLKHASKDAALTAVHALQGALPAGIAAKLDPD